MERIEKVVAYIVRGDRLVVFVHDEDSNPMIESGLQAPAGTVHDGEGPAEAVLREAHEETGLLGLRIVAYLGDADWDVRPSGDAIHHRHFFQLSVPEAPDEWRHIERGDGLDVHPFTFFWLPLDRAHLLVAGQSAMIGRLANDSGSRNL